MGEEGRDIIIVGSKEFIKFIKGAWLNMQIHDNGHTEQMNQ